MKLKFLLPISAALIAISAVSCGSNAEQEASGEVLVDDYGRVLVKNDNEKYLEENAKKEGVVVTESGLQYRVIKEGTGAKPGATDKVKVHYTGRLVNGKVFDSSEERGEPATFGVNQVIAGWTEALQLMSEGAEWELVIPSDLAYGERGAGGSIPGGSTLIFNVKLLEVEK